MACLIGQPVKINVFGRALLLPALQPEGKDPLFSLAQLAGNAKNTTAFDPHGEAEGLPILLRQYLGGQLGGPKHHTE